MAARAFQGIGGAMMVPCGPACDFKDDSEVGTRRGARLVDHAGAARTGAWDRRVGGFITTVFSLALDLLD